MDGISVLAIIQVAERVVVICGKYIIAAKNAKKEIEHVRREVVNLRKLLEKLSAMLDSSDCSKLSTSQDINVHMTECSSILADLEKKIEIGKAEKAMSKAGLRTLKWPLKRKDVEEVIATLQRCKDSLNLALQIDQTTLMTELAHKIDLARLPVAAGAEFDSYADQHEDECLPETRTNLRRQIAEWAGCPGGKRIFWLNGMAGTGKSTISRTVARELNERKLLGASFFFKRGEGDRGNAARLFSTVIRQLMICIPGLIPNVSKVIEDDPSIASKALKEQFDKLLLRPLLNLKQSNQKASTKVIVIDALDECEREVDIRVILQQLPRVQELSSVHLRIFVTSRPELPIRLGFRQLEHDDHQDFVLHEIPRSVIEHDIALFLNYRFARIRKERSLPSTWPGDDSIQKIVAMATPLFIFAATVCLFVGDRNWNPEKRLEVILKDQATNQASKSGGTYTSKLERTYRPILNQLLTGQDEDESEQLIREFREIVGAIVILRSPLSVLALSRFLDISKDDINNRLNSLHSVLSVPIDLDAPVRPLHLSFRDWLLDPKEEGKNPFWVDEKEVHGKIVTRCLATMQRGLRRNICKLPSLGSLRENIDPENINRQLPADIQYACRYWVFHLEESEKYLTDRDEIHVFLQGRLLHWLEAMSILGIISECVTLMNKLNSRIRDTGAAESEVSAFLYDAKRFVLANVQIGDAAPLQLYSSGLVFAPETSIIRRTFRREIPECISKLPEVQKSWGAELQTLESHPKRPISVAFSYPDGGLLASGGEDGTVKIWDATTGALQQTLEEFSSPVISVAFSPDGKLLASLGKSEVNLWDVVTGALEKSLKTPADPQNSMRLPNPSLAFSPDSGLLASYATEMVYFWDVATGILVRSWTKPIESVRSPINSIAISPDSKLIASGLVNGTVVLWDARTGTLKNTIDGCSGMGSLVAFSPDSKLVASGGSFDGTIRLWDVATGVLERCLAGHSGGIRNLSFSADGKLVLSWSGDQTIKLWDSTTGILQWNLQLPSSTIHSAAFSPKSGLLASTEFDGSVKLWDTSIKVSEQGTLVASHLSSKVDAVALSSNCKLTASFSANQTVELRDTATGDLLQTLGNHATQIRGGSRRCRLAFSPDDRLLGALVEEPRDFDTKLKIWEISTGSLRYSQKYELWTIRRIVFSPDSKSVVLSRSGKTFDIWDIESETFQRRVTLERDLGPVQDIAVSPDNKSIALTSRDGTVTVWDIFTGLLLRILEDSVSHRDLFLPKWPGALAFSPSGKLLASAGRAFDDRPEIWLWNATTGALLHKLPSAGITSLQFSTHSPYLETNLGNINIQPWYHDYKTDMPSATVDMRLEGQWMVLHGEKILWIPSDYIASYSPCSACRNDTLVLGHRSEGFCILQFRPQKARTEERPCT